MKTKPDEFEVKDLHVARIGIRDMLHEGQRKHMIHGLIEVDVTEPRQHLRDHRAETGEKLSFTAFLVNCLAKAVDENKIVHGYRKGRSKVVIFGDVDVNTQIERDVQGRKWVMPYIIRAANGKSFREIHDEIRAAQSKEVEGAKEYKQYNWYRLMPWFIRRLFWRIYARSPQMEKKIAGTVGLSAVGMFGKGGGWGIPITTQTLLVVVGGIAEKPGLVNDRIEKRDYLSVTLSFDHDIIDGAPAARFTQRFKELIESSYSLLDEGKIETLVH